MYASTLMIEMYKVSEGSFSLSVSAGVMIINMSNFLGSIIGMVGSRYMGRKTILITGHLVIFLCHLLVGVLMTNGFYMGVFIIICLTVITF